MEVQLVKDSMMSFLIMTPIFKIKRLRLRHSLFIQHMFDIMNAHVASMLELERVMVNIVVD